MRQRKLRSFLLLLEVKVNTDALAGCLSRQALKPLLLSLFSQSPTNINHSIFFSE